MRVTNSMVANTVTYNMQRSLQRFLELQTSVSSGRRINKPSDDPLGTLRDLDYRTELSKIEQYRNNISQASNWMSTYDSVMADVKDLVSSAKEIAVSMANDTYDEVAREAAANEVQSIFDQIMQLANTQLDGRQMFSGFKTKIKPFEFSSHGVVYQGDSGKIEFEVEASMRQQVNINGADTFLKSFSVLGEDSDLNVGVTAATLLANLNSGNGIDLASGTFQITDLNDLSKISTIDISAATTVDEAIIAINAQLAADGLDMTVSLGGEGNNLLVDTTQSGLISTDTVVARLNNGMGITPALDSLRITDGAGINSIIDLSSATTVGDIITEFNSQVAAVGIANVTMGLNASGTGFEISDTNGVPLGLTIENISTDDETADQLGITGSVGSLLVGEDLNPQVSFEISEISGTTAADLGLVGVYSHDSAGTDLDPQLTADTLLVDINNRIGAESGVFVIWQGERSLRVDMDDPTLTTVQDVLDHINGSSLGVVASINDSENGIQIRNTDAYRSLMIEDENDGRAARSMGLYGSSDMSGTMLALVNALEKNDSEGVGMLLENFDNAITMALEQRAWVGSTALRLETTDSRLVDLTLSFTKLLSEVEDGDLTQMITKLATYETNYQAALAAAARIIQPSLMNFLD